MNDRIRNLQTYPMVELARRKAELIARGVDVLDFGTGDPVEPTPAVVKQALIDAVPDVSQYPTILGIDELRGAYADWCKRRFGVTLDPATEALPTRGSKEAMFHLPLVLIDTASERDTVVYPEPGYPVMEIGSLYGEAKTHVMSLTADNDYLQDPDDVPADVLARTQIVWLNYPHNPTGQDMPEVLWRKWVDARNEHGFVLCSDECYTELYFGERPRSLLEFAREGCLVFHSLSKRSGMTGYRSGMISGDAKILGAYRKQRAAMGQAQTIWVQQASVAAWNDETHVERRLAAFHAKRDLLCAGLEGLGLTIYPTTSTFYLWVAAPEGETGSSYADKLLEAGIVVSPGSMFGAGNDGFFRIALVPDLAGCERAVERFAAL